MRGEKTFKRKNYTCTAKPMPDADPHKYGEFVFNL